MLDGDRRGAIAFVQFVTGGVRFVTRGFECAGSAVFRSAPGATLSLSHDAGSPRTHHHTP